MSERPASLLAELPGFSGAIALISPVGVAALAGDGFLATTVFAGRRELRMRRGAMIRRT